MSSEPMPYNGIGNDFTNKVIAGLVDRFGGKDELLKACPGWGIFSLYLIRSINSALPSKGTDKDNLCTCHQGVAGCYVHNAPFWQGKSNIESKGMVEKEYCIDENDVKEWFKNDCPVGDAPKEGSSAPICSCDILNIPCPIHGDDGTPAKPELVELKHNNVRAFLRRRCPRSVPLDAKEIDSLAEDICSVFGTKPSLPTEEDLMHFLNDRIGIDIGTHKCEKLAREIHNLLQQKEKE